jgi:hypothetical protein
VTSLTPAIVHQYKERGYYVPAPVLSREAVSGVHAQIPMRNAGQQIRT